MSGKIPKLSSAKTETVQKEKSSKKVTAEDVPDVEAKVETVQKEKDSKKVTAEDVPDVEAKVETVQKEKDSKKVTAEDVPDVEAKVETVKKEKGSKKVTAEDVPDVEAKVETVPDQKGGKKAVAAKVEAKTEATPSQKGDKKATAAKTVKVAKKSTPPAKVETEPGQKGGKKAAVKTEKVAKIPAHVEECEETGDRRIRSFKVKLPGREEFEGRFTGLTPYQAANKALSKYYRETEKPKLEIIFSICESTRKSKKTVYSYNGKRQKLVTPVTYKIQDGREIVKNFKNSLKKIKKSETVTESS
jgi:hypothetical protein